MQKKILRWLTLYVRRGNQRRAWKKVVQAMACIVVFCTTYALILPAITMEQPTSCGKEVHVHSEECYAQQPVMVAACEMEEDVLVLHTHDGLCRDAEGMLTCSIPEWPPHTHEESCYTRGETPVCEYVHVHTDVCTGTQSVLTCSLEEGAEHTHAEACYTQQELVCELTTEEGHVHTMDCYPAELHCQLIEFPLHRHEENCYSADGTLTCTMLEVILHQHEESCLVPTENVQTVLVCGLEAHTHDDSCYPEEQITYLCGDEAHAHDASCLVQDLDLAADVETPEQWEKAFEELELTGDWAKDLLTIAQTQLGYQESVKNVILDGETLKGYTRYGAKYDAPYADWSALFVRFCLDYAGVMNYPVHSDSQAWINALAEQQLFTPAGDYMPQPGDLVFLDVDAGTEEEDDTADHVAIAVEQEPETGAWKCIVGDLKNGRVDYKTIELTDETLVGFGPLPEAPMPAEQMNQAAAAAALIAQLPEEESARESLRQLNIDQDKSGFDASLTQWKDQAAAARTAVMALNEDQLALVDNLSRLVALEALCERAQWYDLLTLTADDAVICALQAEVTENRTAENQQTMFFTFVGETQTYSGARYAQGRVKLELRLPVAQELAVFDTEAMPWLEEATVTTVTDEESQAVTQVLTGCLRLTAERLELPAVPDFFELNVAVKPLQMAHGDKLNIQLSAAMEHNTWGGICETHQAEETKTVVSETVTITAPAAAETQQAEYEALLAQHESILAQELPTEDLASAGQNFWESVSEAYQAGKLSEDAYRDLTEKANRLIYGDLDSLAEPGDPLAIQRLMDSGWMTEFSTPVNSTSAEPTEPDVDLAALYSGFRKPALFANSAANGEDSLDQIIEEGGGNTSTEGAVFVSKTIAATDTENVFDITLDVITKDVVTEVYKEPDMAVVIVMDISNTMTKVFGSTTRYKAAMTAAESFMDAFAANNLGASKIGFVAFNTDAHEIFGMQDCSTTAQATSLKNIMRTKTGAIINATDYAVSHSRFTNIEGGLKRAYDMLASMNNKNKYIIFLSDGFPTTYLNTKSSEPYDGYDPYTSSGTKGADGVFYDYITKYYCDSGTSYSDKAAIRARQQAMNIKDKGATIFSVGVDIGAQTIAGYERTGLSVIDRTSTTYEIGSANSTAAYKNWLRDKIGSGYYYDSTDTTQLNAAFNQIFTTIKELNADSAHLDWVATDPMPGMGVHEMKDIEFIGFYDKEYNLVSTDLVGTSAMGWDYENTATFEEAKQTIKWDLKQSRYIAITAGNTTNYHCSLTYRIRLKNENADFEEWTELATNDKTFLTYRVINKQGDDVTVSAQDKVDFPIPSVRGYLADLEFTKTDSHNAPLAGVEFTLTHAASCAVCRGDTYWNATLGAANSATAVPLPVYTATSDTDGKVTFTNIPSGHDYILEEPEIPAGYLGNENTYQVGVHYDTLTVTVTDKDGNPVTWDNIVVNHNMYTLPETGGVGTQMYTFSGLLVMLAALTYFGCSQRRKRERRADR